MTNETNPYDTEYEYVFKQFDENGTVVIPDYAVGITIDSMGDFGDGIVVNVKYLIPVKNNE